MDVRSLVNDARVLLGLLRRSQWGDLHVRTPNGEIFIARHGGGVNPLRRVAQDPAAAASDVGDVAGIAAGQVIRAPHVGTVLAATPAHTPVEANAVLCRLAVLGDVFEVTSPHAGVVVELFVADGSLVEYESPLFTLNRPQ